MTPDELRAIVRDAVAEAMAGVQVAARREWIPIHEFAELRGKSVPTVRRWIAEGRVEARGPKGAREVRA